MSAAILVLNAGSSTIKFTLYRAAWPLDQSDMICGGLVDAIGRQARFTASDSTGRILVDARQKDISTSEDGLRVLLQWLARNFATLQLTAVGHRVVHGGARYAEPVFVDNEVIAALRKLIPIAPLHQPHHIAAIETIAKLHPGLPQVACFDTAFHHAQSRLATAFALPRALAAEGIRRYGFHGLSYEYIADVLPDVLGAEQSERRIVIAHLGSGASLCAIAGRKSVATTMGFTPLDGLVMGRRCGALDPGVVLYLIQQKRMSAEAVHALLYRESGLFGLSGISDDMRELLASDNARAKEAIDLFVYRICRELGSLAAAMGGLDGLVFTAGIGENSPEIRRRVCKGARWLGVEIDDDANRRHDPRISRTSSPASAWIIPTNEEIVIARHTLRLIASTSG